MGGGRPWRAAEAGCWPARWGRFERLGRRAWQGPRAARNGQRVSAAGGGRGSRRHFKCSTWQARPRRPFLVGKETLPRPRDRHWRRFKTLAPLPRAAFSGGCSCSANCLFMSAGAPRAACAADVPFAAFWSGPGSPAPAGARAAASAVDGPGVSPGHADGVRGASCSVALAMRAAGFAARPAACCVAATALPPELLAAMAPQTRA